MANPEKSGDASVVSAVGLSASSCILMNCLVAMHVLRDGMQPRIVVDTSVPMAPILPPGENRDISIAEFDAETGFRTLAARGSVEKGLALLDTLDAASAPPADSRK